MTTATKPSTLFGVADLVVRVYRVGNRPSESFTCAIERVYGDVCSITINGAHEAYCRLTGRCIGVEVVEESTEDLIVFKKPKGGVYRAIHSSEYQGHTAKDF